jgi:hypothetical protein
MSAISYRFMTQIQQLMAMVHEVNKTPDSPPRKQQRPQPYRTSPSGMTLQDVPGTTIDSPPRGPSRTNQSHSPPTSPI